MCDVCTRCKAAPEQALKIISEAMEKKGLTKHLSILLDEVLNTEVEKAVNKQTEYRAFRAMTKKQNEPPE